MVVPVDRFCLGDSFLRTDSRHLATSQRANPRREEEIGVQRRRSLRPRQGARLRSRSQAQFDLSCAPWPTAMESRRKSRRCRDGRDGRDGRRKGKGRDVEVEKGGAVGGRKPRGEPGGGGCEGGGVDGGGLAKVEGRWDRLRGDPGFPAVREVERVESTSRAKARRPELFARVAHEVVRVRVGEVGGVPKADGQGCATVVELGRQRGEVESRRVLAGGLVRREVAKRIGRVVDRGRRGGRDRLG